MFNRNPQPILPKGGSFLNHDPSRSALVLAQLTTLANDRTGWPDMMGSAGLLSSMTQRVARRFQR